MPTKTKVEHKYVPPSFIDKKLIEALSEQKQEYWANRILGNPGQGKKPKLDKVFKASEATISFDNLGNEIVHNRANRRNRPANDPQYTKATQSLKVARAKEKIRETAIAKKAAKKEKKNAEK